MSYSTQRDKAVKDCLLWVVTDMRYIDTTLDEADPDTEARKSLRQTIEAVLAYVIDDNDQPMFLLIWEQQRLDEHALAEAARWILYCLPLNADYKQRIDRLREELRELC